MNDLSGDELKAVFQLCQPNAKGLISLSKLQNLFDQHTNQLNGDPSINNKVNHLKIFRATFQHSIWAQSYKTFRRLFRRLTLFVNLTELGA